MVQAMIVLALALQLKHRPLQSKSLAINMQQGMLDMSWVDSALNGDRWHDHVVKQCRFPAWIGFPTRMPANSMFWAQQSSSAITHSPLC